MITKRPSDERGRGEHGWLRSRHSFSFADYVDPRFMGYRTLRVINEDWVAPDSGFPTHPHRDMEIVTYIISGELEHRDSMGNGSVIRPGEVQRMSAGTGVRHSEMNPSTQQDVHLLQIWIEPDRRGLPPSYEQRSFDPSAPGLEVIAAPAGQGGVVTIHQDARILAGRMAAGEEIALPLQAGRHLWVQVIEGTIEVDGVRLEPGDGAFGEVPGEMGVKAAEAAHLLVFDLA